MGLNYDKFKRDEVSEGSVWTSYSDLFMILAFVFLLLYVVSSLRTGAGAMMSKMTQDALEQENMELKDQLSAYEALKNQYLQKESSLTEQKQYKKLMGQLELLQDNTDTENSKLQRQITKNKAKKQALNEYQKMIKSIIDANLVSKSRVKRRDNVINSQEVALTRQLDSLQVKKDMILAKNDQVKNLENSIENEQRKLSQKNREVQKLKSQVDSKVSELKALEKKGKITKKQMLAKIERVKNESKDSIKKLSEQAQDQKEALLASINDLENQKQEKEQLLSDVSKAKTQLEGKLVQAQKTYKKSQQQMLSNLEKQKENFQAIKNDLANENTQLANTNSKLTNKNSQLGQSISKLQKLVNAKKKLAKQLQSAFKSKNIQASVNLETGDVEIDFGKEYFNLGSSKLKSGMRNVVKKLIPEYANILYKDKNVAKKIKSVEIIGFASPTYKGKIINPNDLSSKNQKAVNYNLDLSYFRAKSIFSYVFNKSKLKFPEQQRMLRDVKVTGRSFLTEELKGRAPASINMKNYCSKYNCAKSQKVIIKFSMD